MTTISDTTENRSSEAGAALEVTFHKAVANYADAYETLAWHALDALWNQNAALPDSNLRDFFHSLKAMSLQHAANEVCERFDHVTFPYFLFICLEDVSYSSVRFSNEELLSIHDLQLLLTNEIVEKGASLSANRLLELTKDSPITPVYSAFTHFPKSSLLYFEKAVEQADVLWRETEVRFETPWLVRDKLVEQEWNPFVFVEVTGTAHSVGTFVVNSLLKSTWCAGYDDICIPTAEAMKKFNELFC
jgi:hypothetical protein